MLNGQRVSPCMVLLVVTDRAEPARVSRFASGPSTGRLGAPS
jgi:hypothetical protein